MSLAWDSGQLSVMRWALPSLLSLVAELAEQWRRGTAKRKDVALAIRC